MSYKIIINTLLSLSALACSELPKSTQMGQTIGRFQVQDNVVTDTRSNLMWTRCLLGAAWNGTTCEGKAASYGWQQAQELAKNSNYADFNDWRIPTFEELKSLADKETAVPMVKILILIKRVSPPQTVKALRVAPHITMDIVVGNGHQRQ